ncbi:rab2a [Anaeramoeba flamelloides]|uniref:Rab2a n=1 Tax=Anaeramoeba flamelloides TaxID=1746091 RepID=A0AAV7ZTW9_9EUKA|nr:rab2a member ras oncogene family [Anaeramoeba flamelloides]KAJ6239330.1 rab2a [Anaeramoeba flamelloides]
MIFKFIIVGAMGTGKSSLLHRFTEDKFYTDCPHTIGVEFATKTIEVMNERIKIQIWDTAGQERFRAITRSYFRSSVCTFLVYDVNSRKTFNQLNGWLNDSRNLTNPNSIIVLVGNKIDLENRVVSREEGEEFASENDLFYIETSAKTGEFVENAFTLAAKEVYKLVKAGTLKLTNNQEEDSVDIGGGKTKKGGCC